MWRARLEGSGLKISGPKTYHMDCKFADPSRATQHLYFNGQQISECTEFKYLGSIVNNMATCDEDVKHRINVAWMKWRENSSIFCDRKMPLKLKGRMHSTTVRQAMLHGSQCWTMYKRFEDKITAADMKMCRIACGVTKLDHIRSTKIRGSLHIKKFVVEKLHDDRKGWDEHVLRRPPEIPVQRAMAANIQRRPRRGRPTDTWVAQMTRLQHQQQQ